MKYCFRGYDMITVLAGGTGSVKLVRGLVAQEKKSM